MNVIDRAFQDMFTKRSATAGSSEEKSAWWSAFLGMAVGKGISAVNYKQALTLPAFYNGVDQIGNALAIIPFNVYRKTDEGRERAAEHPVDRLLSREPDGPNGYFTPFLFKKITQTSVLLRGNCLWRIVSMGSGGQRLKYIPWDEVSDVRKMRNDDNSTQLVYMTSKDGPLMASEVLHFKGFSYDGIVGVSVIRHACMQLNIAMEIQQFSYANFENRGVRHGVVSTEKSLKPEGKEKIVAGVKAGFSSLGQSRVIVLDEGMTYAPVSLTAQEAEIIESQKFSIEDMARWLNIPLPKIKSVTQSTNNNIEQQSLDFLTDTILPWVTNFEQECDKKLFTPAEKESLYVKGNMNAMVRPDMKTRSEFYKTLMNGIFTPNEIRELEEKNKLPGGDELRFQVNTQTQTQIDKENNAGNE